MSQALFQGLKADNLSRYMASAVHSLQKAIVAGDMSLTQLLRQTKLIASKLGLSDVEKWVDAELSGYPKGEKPPVYREIAIEALEVHYPSHGWGFVGHANGFKFPYPLSIADVINLSQHQLVQFPIPVPNPLNVTDQFGEPLEYPQTLTTSGDKFKRIIEAVTDRLLQWTIELEKRGIKGEDMDFNEKEKQAATHQTFNIQNLTGV